MFGKLMKYELRHLIRIFAPMWAIVTMLCVLSRLIIKPELDGFMYAEGMAAIVPVVVLMLTIFGMLTMTIVAAVVLIQRFYKGMYGDEGYLMFTLPVTTGQLVNAKALSALLLMLATSLVTTLGIAVMVSYPDLWKAAIDVIGIDLRTAISLLLDMNGVTESQAIAMLCWGVALVPVELLSGIYTVYLAISVGQIWRKHPVAGGILGWYALVLAVGAVESMLMQALGISPMEMLMEGVELSMQSWQMMLFSTVENVVLCVIFFFATKLILDKKLNIA